LMLCRALATRAPFASKSNCLDEPASGFSKGDRR
jgi:hypothetical protein